MCRLHHKGCSAHKRGCESRQDIYEKVVSKYEKHCQTQGAQHLGCNFAWENENRCADFTTRGRKNKTQVAKVAGASKKTCGPTRRDYCKNQCVTKNGPTKCII